MSRVRAFQLLCIASALLYATYLALPHAGLRHSAQEAQLLSMSGYGGLPFVQHPVFYLSFGVAKLIATVALVFLLSWGRWLLAAIAVAGLVSLPFSGLSVGTPLDGIIGSLLTLSDGAVLALAFLHPLRKRCGAMSASNPSIERTSSGKLRFPTAPAHVER